MPEFRFRARALRSGAPIPVEVFLADRSRGYTPRNNDEYLVITPNQPGPQAWYAMARNVRVALGQGEGGTFELIVDESSFDVEVVELPTRKAG